MVFVPIGRLAADARCWVDPFSPGTLDDSPIARFRSPKGATFTPSPHGECERILMSGRVAPRYPHARVFAGGRRDALARDSANPTTQPKRYQAHKVGRAVLTTPLGPGSPQGCTKG